MRSRLVPTLVVVAVVAAAVFAAVTAKPAQSFPSKAAACTGCHPTAPASATVKATPDTATPAPGATYTVTVDLSGLTASGDTGYWITNGAGTPAVSVYGGGTGTNQTTYTRTMTAPSTPGSYTCTVWCDRGDKSTGQAKSTTYSITVQATPAPTAAITTLTPNHGLTGTSVVIAGSNLGTGGTVKFGATTATTTAWSATSVTATVPASLAPGSVNVSVAPTGGSASNALSFTVDAPPSTGDTTAPVSSASGVRAERWYNHTLRIRLSAVDELGGSGVASLTYTIDGGAPATITGASTTATLTVDAKGHTTDGAHSITWFATDVAGNAETAQTLMVNVDTVKPNTKAPSAVKVRRYKTATLKYEVGDADPNGGTARVTILVKDRRGDVVKRLRLGNKQVDTALTASFACKLPRGTYRFFVKATDEAGNAQANIATRTLTVY